MVMLYLLSILVGEQDMVVFYIYPLSLLLREQDMVVLYIYPLSYFMNSIHYAKYIGVWSFKLMHFVDYPLASVVFCSDKPTVIT